MSVHLVECYEVRCDGYYAKPYNAYPCDASLHEYSPWRENIEGVARRAGWYEIPFWTEFITNEYGERVTGWLCPKHAEQYHAKRAREAAVVDSQASDAPERRDTASEAQEGTQSLSEDTPGLTTCEYHDVARHRCGKPIVWTRFGFVHVDQQADQGHKARAYQR